MNIFVFLIKSISYLIFYFFLTLPHGPFLKLSSVYQIKPFTSLSFKPIVQHIFSSKQISPFPSRIPMLIIEKSW